MINTQLERIEKIFEKIEYSKYSLKIDLIIIISNFKPNLVSLLGEGGQAKVFKAKFHGKDVAMKYISLDKVKDSYKYDYRSYGCHEFYEQETFSSNFTRIYNFNGCVFPWNLSKGFQKNWTFGEKLCERLKDG